LIGSLRKESVNRGLYNTYKELAKDTMRIEEISIRDFPLYDADLKTPVNVVAAAKLIQNADGVLFFSPEYNYSVPGALKNALDWLSRQEPQPFSAKPAALLGASPGAIGTARMQYHLRQIGVFLNIDFLNKPEVMVGNAYAKIKDGKVIDADTIEFLEQHVKTFSAFVTK
jgi:chromate reductase